MINYANQEVEYNGCPGCAYAKHEFILPCGMAYENEKFTLSQDWELPIEGFMIVSPKRCVEKLSDLTREERIELLQSQVQHQRITTKELGVMCEQNNILLHEEVLEPIGFNTCDRCGEYGDSEMDFVWVDCFPWDEDNENDQAIIKAMEQEGVDYCALCWSCVEKLKKKGKQ